MAAASPRDHRESRGFEPKPEVKSGSHSIQGARVDDAVSDVRNVLGSGAVDEVMIQKHAIEKLLNSALAKAIETVIGKPADKRFIGLSKVQSPFVAELKRKAIQFDKALFF